MRVTRIATALALWSATASADPGGDCAQRLDLERAESACTQIIERGNRERVETLVDAYKSRADAYFAGGDYERAIADLGVAIKLNPQDFDAYVRRGLAYEAKADHQDAISDFSAAIRLKPGYATPYTMRGGAYEKAGDKTAAVADFRSALAIDHSLRTVEDAIRRLGATP